MKSIKTGIVRVLMVIVFMAGVGSMAGAQTCTYEFTMVRSPEALNADELRQQVDRLGVKYTETEFDTVVSKRTNGFTAKKVVQYKREGGRFEGPLHGVNGMTLELTLERFMVDDEAFSCYYGTDKVKGMLIVRKPEHIRSVCTAYEERLLLGEGSLADRVKAIQSDLELKRQNNPNKENAKLTKEGFDVYFGKNLIYKVILNQRDSVSIVKMVPANFETLTYRQIPDQRFEEFETYVPIGATVSDYRLSDSFPAQYKWEATLPPISAIANKKADHGDRSTFPVGIALSLAVLTCGTCVGLSFFVKSRKK